MADNDKVLKEAFLKAIQEYVLFDRSDKKHLSEKKFIYKRKKKLIEFFKILVDLNSDKDEAVTRRKYNYESAFFIGVIEELNKDFESAYKEVFEDIRKDLVEEVYQNVYYSIPWILKNTDIKHRDSILRQVNKETVEYEVEVKGGRKFYSFNMKNVKKLEALIPTRNDD